MRRMQAKAKEGRKEEGGREGAGTEKDRIGKGGEEGRERGGERERERKEGKGERERKKQKGLPFLKCWKNVYKTYKDRYAHADLKLLLSEPEKLKPGEVLLRFQMFWSLSRKEGRQGGNTISKCSCFNSSLSA